MVATIFSTEKVARLLELPDWRVVRFAQKKEYGITPRYAEAEGTGSRRLYDLENVCEMALASALVEAGLRIQVIGRVVKQVRRMGGLSYLLSMPIEKLKTQYLGVVRSPKGKIMGQEAVFVQSWEQLQNIFERNRKASLLVFPVGLRFFALALHLERDV